MKKIHEIVPIIFLTIFSFTISYAQVSKVSLDGVVKERIDEFSKDNKLKENYTTKNISSVYVDIYEEEKIISSTKTDDKGYYKLVFSFQPLKNYYFKFSKPGYYNVIFEISTHNLKDASEFEFTDWNLLLRKIAIGVDGSAYNKPFEKYYYSPKKEQFEPNLNYNISFLDEIDKINKQIEDKAKNGNLKYEKLLDSKEIDAIMSIAKSDANNLIENARKQAENVINSTESSSQQRAQLILSEAKKQANALMEKAENKVFENNSALKEQMEQMRKRELNRLRDSINNELASIQTKNEQEIEEQKIEPHKTEPKPQLTNKKENDKPFSIKDLNYSAEYIEKEQNQINNKLTNITSERHQLELDKLRAKTHADSIKIYERELALIASESEVKLAQTKLENIQHEMLLKTQLVESQKKVIYSIATALIILAILIFIVFRNYKIKQRINKVLEQQNIEISNKKDEISRQNIEIREKNNHIVSSINYAQRIQQAILPPESFIKKLLPNSCVFYRPKEIVSGDFYWIEPVDDKIIFAVVDCTGHGVPGAFMSIVGHNALNEAIKEKHITKPSEILNELKQMLTETLRQSERDEKIKDGMDLALCSLDPKTLELEFSGAYNPLWIVREGELIEIQADKQPIGSFMEDKILPFTNVSIQLYKNDKLYIFTDGYSDQFDESSTKKYMKKRFKQFLLSIENQPILEHANLLSQNHDDWRKEEEQVDDICVFCLEV